MRLSLFSITAILASFVAANPILAPRASNPFSLYGHFGSRTSDLLLGIRSVREPGHLGYYQLGFFGQTSDPIEFVFTKDANHPGPVLDALLNGFEMYVPRFPLPGITPLILLQGDASDHERGYWLHILSSSPCRPIQHCAEWVTVPRSILHQIREFLL